MKRAAKSLNEARLDSNVKMGKTKCRRVGHDLSLLHQFDERYAACPRCGDQFLTEDMEKGWTGGWFLKVELAAKENRRKGA